VGRARHYRWHARARTGGGGQVMKVMIRNSATGLSAYVPKKDLEQRIIAQEHPDLWGGWVKLKNGWTLGLPAMAADTRLPITVNAKRLDAADD
jgi:nitrogen fixation protein NifT